MPPSFVWQEGADLCLRIYAVPKGLTTAIDGMKEDALRVRLHALPENGAANKALVRFFADLLKKPASAILVRAGHRSRHKTLVVRDMSEQDPLIRRLGAKKI